MLRLAISGFGAVAHVGSVPYPEGRPEGRPEGPPDSPQTPIAVHVEPQAAAAWVPPSFTCGQGANGCPPGEECQIECSNVPKGFYCDTQDPQGYCCCEDNAEESLYHICPDDLVFDPLKKQCTFSHLARQDLCGDGLVPTFQPLTEPHNKNPTVCGEEVCYGDKCVISCNLQAGFYCDNHNPEGFCFCNGHGDEPCEFDSYWARCPSGLHWDKEMKQCNIPENINTPCETVTPPPPTEAPTVCGSDDCNGQTPCRIECNLDEGFYCSAQNPMGFCFCGGVSHNRHGGGMESYYNECPYGLVFDTVLNECNVPNENSCAGDIPNFTVTVPVEETEPPPPPPCAGQPCLNGGTCTDGPNNADYTCTCTSNGLGLMYTGKNCETDVACQAQPCVNGECVNSDDYLDYECTACGDFVGKNCDQTSPCADQDVPGLEPCKNGGTCTNDADFQGYECDCTASFTGFNCEIQIPCSQLPCQNNGFCTDFEDFSDYECVCPDTHTGKDCEIVVPCSSSPCQQGGTCVNNDDYLDYTCECPVTHAGKDCEIERACGTEPCQNEGTCVDSDDFSTYTCDCPVTHTGEHCELELPCVTLPCQNGGECQNTADFLSYTCTCPNSHTGDTCEIEIPCESNVWIGLFGSPTPCQNNGTCENTADFSDYTCNCPDTHTGRNCETLIPCSAAPCLNGGTCTDEADLSDYTCACPATHTGKNCETEIPCSASPCQNAGNCVDADDYSDYTCECTDNFTGKDCEIEIPCSKQPCQNGGTCTDSEDLTDYGCFCLATHTGRDCEIEKPCTPAPCQNGGTCLDILDFTDYQCVCPDTHTGTNCELAIPCEPNPCLWGGRCTNNDDFTDYECTCEEGFIGKNCEDLEPNLSHCAMKTPCENGGTCEDRCMRPNTIGSCPQSYMNYPGPVGTGDNNILAMVDVYRFQEIEFDMFLNFPGPGFAPPNLDRSIIHIGNTTYHRYPSLWLKGVRGQDSELNSFNIFGANNYNPEDKSDFDGTGHEILDDDAPFAIATGFLMGKSYHMRARTFPNSDGAIVFELYIGKADDPFPAAVMGFPIYRHVVLPKPMSVGDVEPCHNVFAGLKVDGADIAGVELSNLKYSSWECEGDDISAMSGPEGFVSFGDYECSCPAGFSGRNCENAD